MKIRAQESSEVLLKVIKNPVTNHLPANAVKIGTSTKARLVKLREYVPQLNKNSPIVFVVGAVAKGNPCKLEKIE
jgi:rRNA small subunit pseudouridine methyltransferase Nep1